MATCPQKRLSQLVGQTDRKPTDVPLADISEPADDWGVHKGFNSSYEEREPVELRVHGDIPPWAAGVLYRTGIGPTEFETETGKPFKVHHWFDSMAVVHRFQILAPDEDHPNVRVVYNSRSTCDGLIEQIKKTGRGDEITFGAKYEPCTSFFQKAMSVFRPVAEGAPDCRSIFVSLSVNYPGLDSTGQQMQKGHASGIQTLCNKTDTTELQMLDPETLEPIGLATQNTLHPDLKGPMSAAHARSDPATGDIYNYNLELGRIATYRIFRVSASTGKTSILATIPGDAAYIHSFFLTENYMILCVWNSFLVAGGLKILMKRNIIDALADYDRTRPARWYVVDRRTPEEGGRGVVATYESKDFFCFHSVNAFEIPSSCGEGSDIIADLITYDNLDVLKEFYLPNLLASTPEDARNPAYKTHYRRFRLPAVPINTSRSKLEATLEFESEPVQTPELPTLNPRCVTRPHRYVYGVNKNGFSSFMDGLVKFDTATGESQHWYMPGQTPGEAIFVPRPISAAGTDEELDEDDGVLLSIVLDGPAGRSYLLVLDAKTMEEVGRADANGVIGFGLHGTHVSASKSIRVDV